MGRKRLRRPRAAVDTNLFVSGLIIKRGGPHDLLLAWRHYRFTLVISDEQQAELEEVLHRSEITEKYGLSEAEIAAVLRRVSKKALKVTLRSRPPVRVRDPKDEKILATALGGRADYLVTGDDDLLVLRDQPRLDGLKIVNVQEFLRALRD